YKVRVRPPPRPTPFPSTTLFRSDHADIYADFEAVSLAFRRLVRLVPRRGLLLVGADSPGARSLVPAAPSRVQTFGLGDDVEWQAHDLTTQGGSTRFRVRRRGAPL